MTLARLAYFTLWAGTGDARGAAHAFLAEAPATDPTGEAILRLLDAAHWRAEDVADFESRGMAVLVDRPTWGGGGRFWLAAPSRKHTLLPPAPRLAPSGIKALASALADALAGDPEKQPQESVFRGQGVGG